MFRRWFLAAIVLAACPAAAQSTAPAPVPHLQTVSANPFGLVFGWFNAEYERKLTPTLTWGLSGSMLDIDDFEYRHGNALLRYYPQGAALKGFFLGLRTGVYQVSHDDPGDENATFAGAGFELGYTWLLGPAQRVAISLGAGANRLFGDALEEASLTVPTVRLAHVGISF